MCDIEKETKMFSVKGKIFNFDLDDCYKIKSGICPIETGDDSIDCVCNVLKKELLETNFIMTNRKAIPSICYYSKCGHYACDGGQHRICIAGKLKHDIEIEYNIAHHDMLCTVCANLSTTAGDCISYLEKF